jgi:cytoskeleton protein RodZ
VDDINAAAVSSNPGARLQLARLQAGLSVADTADRLHLDQATLDALESGRFEGLGPGVYVRGHLRRYAELVNLPEEEIMAAYEAWSGRLLAMPDLRQVITAPAVRSGLRGFELKPLHGLIAAIVLVLLALVWWALRQMPPASSKKAVATSAVPAAAPVVPPAAPPTVPAVAPVASMAPKASAPQAAPVNPPLQLLVHFRRDSWIEISDGDGKKLLHQLGIAGSRHRVAGSVPLHIFLGDPTAVELQMDGHPLSLTGPGKVKLRHFLLDGDGHTTDVGSASQP